MFIELSELRGKKDASQFSNLAKEEALFFLNKTLLTKQVQSITEVCLMPHYKKTFKNRKVNWMHLNIPYEYTRSA